MSSEPGGFESSQGDTAAPVVSAGLSANTESDKSIIHRKTNRNFRQLLFTTTQIITNRIEIID